MIKRQYIYPISSKGFRIAGMYFSQVSETTYILGSRLTPMEELVCLSTKDNICRFKYLPNGMEFDVDITL